jgi:signal transduction histidine kinase
VTVSIDRPEPDDSSVVVVVSDDGSGLPEDVAGYLDGSIEELSAKHGLGIRLVRGFVRAHGGCIRVASNHHGTQIHIELPIEPETK